jgi:hypothetical protein
MLDLQFDDALLDLLHFHGSPRVPFVD